ncbi:MAG: SIR2 family protein [Planctomycetes bacterium]|nr:SIR2 family protein [Planctomycetota bacterium]
MGGTVIVLGAGATRGADFRGPHQNGRPLPARHAGAPLPALDGDFFDRLQEIGEPDHRQLVDTVTADARWVAKGSVYPTLEEMFTFVEAAQALEGAPTKFLINETKPSRVRSRLLAAVALQLGSALCRPNPGKGNDAFYHCKNHLWLAKPSKHGGAGLAAADTIISFNYDCLIDYALARVSQAWSAKQGYGTDTEEWERWTPGEGRDAPTNSLKLLKLHGSLNWLDRKDKKAPIRLSHHNYSDVRRPKLIPPEWNKQTDDQPFKRIWHQALQAIRDARSMVVIGYSMPTTDLSAQVMFRAARQAASGCLEMLVVVNPDDSAAQRIVRTIDDGPGGTAVIRLKHWKDFVELPTGIWRR